MNKHDEQPKSLRDYVVALDIGTTKIATIVGYLNEEGKIDILGHGKCESFGVQYGAIRNIMKTVEGIKLSKNLATSRSNKEISNAYVGIAGRHIQSRIFKHLKLRENGNHDFITQTDIDKMAQELHNVSLQPDESIVDIIPQYFIIDDDQKVEDPIGYLGVKFEGFFQLIIGNDKEIRNIVRCSEDADIVVEDIILEPLASASACLTSDEKKNGALLVDIGGGTTDLAIYHNGNPVYTKVIPIGGNMITKDIAEVCRITDELAEKIKVSYGTCIVEKSNKNNFITIPQFSQQEPIKISEPYLAEIIYCRVQNIIECMITFIKESGYDNLYRNVVITGGGANLRNIRELFNYSLRVPTRIGVPEIGFASSIPAELKHPMYSTAMGLLKYGVEKELKKNEEDNRNDEKGNKEANEENTDKKGKNLLKNLFRYSQKIMESFGEKMS